MEEDDEEFKYGVFAVYPMLGDDGIYHPTWIAVVYTPKPDAQNGFEAGADSPSFSVWAVPGTEVPGHAEQWHKSGDEQ